MSVNETDMFTTRTDGYAKLIESKMQSQQQFAVCEVAEIFNVCNTNVREWIEEGRLLAADLNKDRISHVSSDKPMRPLYKITREAVLDLARRVQGGY